LKISVKTSPKTSNRQVFKNTRNSTKKQAQIRGKTAALATLEWLLCRDDHYPVCRLDIRQDSKFATG